MRELFSLRLGSASLVAAVLGIALLISAGAAPASPSEEVRPQSASSEESQIQDQKQSATSTEKEEERTAVSIHEPELSAGQTVWCVGNPDQFAVSARAVGLDIGGRKNNRQFNRPVGPAVTLEQWSQSTGPADIEDFNAACLPAYEAFAPKASGDGGSSDEELWSLITLLVGAAVGAGGTVLGERRQSHKRDGDLLRELSDGLASAVASYVDVGDGALEQRARDQAHALRGAINRWVKLSPTEANDAKDLIEKLLQEKVAPNLAEPSPELNDWMAEIDEKVQGLADRVALFFQRKK